MASRPTRGVPKDSANIGWIFTHIDSQITVTGLERKEDWW